MPLEEILSVLTTQSFPVTMCIVLLWKLHKDDERHEQLTQRYQSVIDNNTQALTKFIDRCDRLDKL